MRVGNIMVCILLSTVGLCGNTGTLTPLSATAGVRTDYAEPGNIVATIGNVYKQASGSLNSDDRKHHIRTIIFAAMNLETGEIAEWSNPSNNTAGRVQIVMTTPAQGGVCRLMFTQVEKDNNVREYTEKACKTIDSRFWSFSTR